MILNKKSINLKQLILSLKFIWWNNKENFEHISNFLSSLPLRKAKGLFAFYRGMVNSQSKIIQKLSEKERLLYELT